MRAVRAGTVRGICTRVCVCTLAKCNWKIGKKGLRRLRGLSAQGSAAAVAVAVAICHLLLENVREKPRGKFICHPSAKKGCGAGGRARGEWKTRLRY